MVFQGRFSAQLVEAVSKNPFKEHEHNGKHYAEVEPDVEYFIATRILKTPNRSDDNDVVKITYKVDGVDLGYSNLCSPKNETHYSGCWKRVGGDSMHSALKFRRPQFSGGSTVSSMMGKIEVNFYEAIDAGLKKSDDVTCNQMTSPSTTAGAHPKALMSGEGSHVISKKVGKYWRKYKNGALLDTITIHYCTAAGLVDAGVLSPWEPLRAKAPLHRRNLDSHLRDVQPTVLQADPVEKNGVVLYQGGKTELFDLWQLPSDDEQEN